MLKRCMNCMYYERLVRVKDVVFHHYCHFYQSTYSFLKYQGKLKTCPAASLNSEASAVKG
ncbi:MAG: hypothetical protein ACTSQI_10620 [Candidatus Helarchaeota archaeon]